MRYYGFVRREFFDEESGVVYNAAGKNPKTKRLYNAPWMSVFMMEMYKATGDKAFLERMVRLLRVYYSVGGENFYPNGLSLFETVTVLRQAGMAAEAAEIQSYYKTHVENIVKNGTNYPEHEVRYEQTIVTPAVMMLAQYYMLTGDKKLVEECRRHVRVLERFNGDQPSHYLNEISMRHWDGYWFGKCMIYGDTLPALRFRAHVRRVFALRPHFGRRNLSQTRRPRGKKRAQPVPGGRVRFHVVSVSSYLQRARAANFTIISPTSRTGICTFSLNFSARSAETKRCNKKTQSRLTKIHKIHNGTQAAGF